MNKADLIEELGKKEKLKSLFLCFILIMLLCNQNKQEWFAVKSKVAHI
jgi:hypothetical protein